MSRTRNTTVLLGAVLALLALGSPAWAGQGGPELQPQLQPPPKPVAQSAPKPVKMLPPTDFAGNDCSGPTSGLLFWDGMNPIRCVPGSSVTAEGRVGIGITTPRAPLEVTGKVVSRSTTVPAGIVPPDVRLTGDLINILNFHAVGWDAGLSTTTVDGLSRPLIGTYSGWDRTAVYIAGYHAGNSAVNTRWIHMGGGGSPVMSVDLVNRKVGIGTTGPQTALDVAGTVKVGAGGEGCNGSTAGSIRWTGTKFEGCNGSQWRALSGADMIQTTPGSIAGGCTDAWNPSPADSNPYTEASGTLKFFGKMLRYVNTCGHRWCSNRGYATGRIVETNGSIAWAACQ